jgi:NADH:ubiquinone oxidoreductase subunit 2 (subunit N)
MTFNSGDLLYIAPFLVLALSGILLVLAEAFFVGRDRSSLAALAVAGAIASTVTSIALYRHMGPTQAKLLFSEMLVADRTGYVLSGLFGVVAALAALLAPSHQRTHGCSPRPAWCCSLRPPTSPRCSSASRPCRSACTS